MKKYGIVIINTWDEIVSYRLNFAIWRARTVLQFLTVYFFWLVLIPGKKVIFGYTQPLMLTYVLATAFLNAIVFSTRTHEIGEQINNGDLSTFLIKPMNYFAYWLARDVGDKLMNITFAIGEITLLIIVLHPPIFLQSNSLYIFLAVVGAFIATLLYFLIGCLLGLIGFWSAETWAPRFILFILFSFFAGSSFPLDVLPKYILSFFQLTPFPYLIYFPVKIYLGQVAFFDIAKGLCIALVWLGFMIGLLQIIWKKGVKLYAAQGQ